MYIGDKRSTPLQWLPWSFTTLGRTRVRVRSNRSSPLEWRLTTHLDSLHLRSGWLSLCGVWRHGSCHASKLHI